MLQIAEFKLGPESPDPNRPKRYSILIALSLYIVVLVFDSSKYEISEFACVKSYAKNAAHFIENNAFEDDYFL